MTTYTKFPFSKTLMAWAISAVAAFLLSLAWYFLHPVLFGKIEQTLIHPVSIAFSCIVPLLVASLLHFVIARFFARGNLIFMILGTVLMFLSLFSSFMTVGPDGNPIPEGFALLSAPMHFIAGLSAVILIPRIAR